ncbi:MAG TPA: CPBP family glutamic-type intramembrane protease [Myxococcota bacterium]|nr:CPBP family glutamic-type intramembrane protease [Myxococcota bacterium]
MIPDSESEPQPPLTLGFVFVLALLAPLTQFLWMLLFEKIAVQLGPSSLGMATLVTYGGMFALCAARFRVPPARQLAFVPAPLTGWLAVIFLAAAVIVSSELDNVVKAIAPPPVVPPAELGPMPPLAGVALAFLQIGVFPLCYGVFFRGVLQPLASARLGALGAVLVTAFLSAFADAFIPSLISRGLWLLAPALLNALVLCILRQCSRSLWPALALESLWGVVQICAAYQVFGLAGFDAGGGHTPLVWVGSGALLTVVGLALCRAAAREGSARSTPAQS